MTSSELIKLLKQHGWYEVRQSGSHKIFEHKTNASKLSVPDHKGKDLATGTLHQLLKKAGLK